MHFKNVCTCMCTHVSFSYLHVFSFMTVCALMCIIIFQRTLRYRISSPEVHICRCVCLCVCTCSLVSVDSRCVCTLTSVCAHEEGVCVCVV